MKNIILILMVLALGACTNDEILQKDTGQILNLTTDIPEDFDWQMFKSIGLNIGTTQKYSDDYYFKILIYDRNPLFDNKASLINSGVCKKNEDFTTSIDIPSAINTIYLKEINPQGKVVIASLDITDKDTIDYKFSPFFSENNTDNSGSVATTRALNTRAETTILAYVFSNDGATTIEKESDLKKWSYNDFQNQTIYIPENTTLKVSKMDLYEIAKIKLDGTLIVDSDLSIGNGGYIEVFSNGKIEIENNKNLKFNSNSNTLLAIDKGGSVYSEDPEKSGDLIMSTNNVLYNGGEIKVYNLTTSQTEIDNAGSIVVSNKMETHTKDVTNRTGGYIEAKNWDIESTNLNLETNSVIDVTETLKETGSTHNFENINYTSSDDDSWAFISAKNISLTGGIKLQLLGNLKINTDNITNLYNDEYHGIYNYNIVRDNIVFSSYSDRLPYPESGFIVDPGTSEIEPEEIDFPIIQELDNLFTFAAEDNFPNYGDYDMNDLIVDLSQITTYSDKKNKVNVCKMTFTLRAYGAKFKNGFAFQLDNKITKSDIKSITVTNQTTPSLRLENNMFKSTDVVGIPLFEDCFEVFNKNLVNTTKDIFDRDDVEYVVTIEFNSAINKNLLNINKINPFLFIITDFGEFTEIHTPDSYLLDGKNKMLTGKYMWALKIPKNNDAFFQYPLEEVSIKNAYPEFENWIDNQNSSKYKKWYNNPIQTKVQSLRN